MPEDEIFDDGMMNEMLMNPDLYGMEDTGQNDELDDEEED